MAVDIYQSLWQEFVVEAGEHLERLEPLLIAIEAEPPAEGVGRELLGTLFRGMHSIKGMAAALTLKGMERVSHHAEHLLGQVRDGHCVLDRPLAGLLLEAVDELKRLLALSARDQADVPASETVMGRLEAARRSLEGVTEGVTDGGAGFGAAVAEAQAAAGGPPPLHPDQAALAAYVQAMRPHLPALAGLVGSDLERAPVRAAVRLALEAVREGAAALEFPEMARTAGALSALIPLEGCLDYYSREQAIDALALLRREVATLEAATGADGGGRGLDEALSAALALDFNARRRALVEVLGRYDREPEAFAVNGAAVIRAAELAGDIYNHFSFLYNANAGRLLLMVEDVLGHAARGDLALTPELLALVRETLAALAPKPGQPLRDPDPVRTQAALAAFEPAVRRAEALAAGGAGAATAGGDGDETVIAGRQYLAELGVSPGLLDRLNPAQLAEAAEAVADGGRLWEIAAALEEAEDRADRFAVWLESHGRALTSRAVPGATALSFEFLVLTTADDATVLAGLADIDAGGGMLSARRCGAPVIAAAPSPPAERHEPASASPSAPGDGGGAMSASVLRVPGEVVDHFLSVIGEMVTVGSMLDEAVRGDDRHLRPSRELRRIVKELRARGGTDPGLLEALARHAAVQEQRDHDLRKAREQLSASLGRLQEAALELRVVPVETVFARLPRLARDLAASQGKQVRVEIDGHGVRVDKGMVDQLLDPLIHMVRNAIDHGIETPEARAAAGKPPMATLWVRAGQRENRVAIEVADDGRGLDVEAIRKRAVARGLVGDATSRLMRDEDLHRMILTPGFSTAEAITETSGRGVGMDVVHTSVARMGGAIDIRSEAGRGAAFTLRLPLSAAIQDVLLVEGDGRLHAIPVRHLMELTRARPDQIQVVHGRTMMLLHGVLLPVFRLTALLDGGAGRLPAGEPPIVILGDGHRRLGLQVDRVVRRQELFVRDIHPRVASIPGLGGAALLGDGTVVLILDAGDLFQLADARDIGPPPPLPALETVA